MFVQTQKRAPLELAAIRPPTSPRPLHVEDRDARRKERPEQDDDQPRSPIAQHQRSAQPDGQYEQAPGGGDGSRLDPAGDLVRPVQ